MALTETAVAEVLAVIHETYGGKEPSDLTVRVWHATLVGAMTEPELREALLRHLGDPHRGQFQPKPADLIAAVKPPEAADAAVEAVVGRALTAITAGRYRVYSPRGNHWELGRMRDELGREVVESFLEAGGEAGFDDVESAKFASKSFSATLRRRLSVATKAGQIDPARMLEASEALELAPARPQRALPPPRPPEPLRHERAAGILDQLEKRLGAKRRLGSEGGGGELAATEWDARVATLERQRVELLESPGRGEVT